VYQWLKKCDFGYAFSILSIIDITTSFSNPAEKDKEYEQPFCVHVARLTNDPFPLSVISAS
jgi:hypothetical protein